MINSIFLFGKSKINFSLFFLFLVRKKYRKKEKKTNKKNTEVIFQKILKNFVNFKAVFIIIFFGNSKAFA